MENGAGTGFVAGTPGAGLRTRQAAAVRPRQVVRRARRTAVMGTWFDFNAVQTVEAPVDYVFEQYSKLDEMPSWAPWLDSVEIVDYEQGISRWHISSSGFSFSWRARNTEVVPGKVIAWESIDGLKNRGAVTFHRNGDSGSTVSMQLAFQLPTVLRVLFKNNYVSDFINDKLRSELKVFRNIVLQKRRAAEVTGRLQSERRPVKTGSV